MSLLCSMIVIFVNNLMIFYESSVVQLNLIVLKSLFPLSSLLNMILQQENLKKEINFAETSIMKIGISFVWLISYSLKTAEIEKWKKSVLLDFELSEKRKVYLWIILNSLNCFGDFFIENIICCHSRFHFLLSIL